MLGAYYLGETTLGGSVDISATGGFWSGTVQAAWLAGNNHANDMLVIKDWNWQQIKLLEQQAQKEGRTL